MVITIVTLLDKPKIGIWFPIEYWGQYNWISNVSNSMSFSFSPFIYRRRYFSSIVHSKASSMSLAVNSAVRALQRCALEDTDALSKLDIYMI